MIPIEHYFENLLDMGSDIKGEPNKNALSKEVQEAVEICADYIKYNHLLDDTEDNMADMIEDIIVDKLTEIQLEIKKITPIEPTDDEDWQYGCFHGLELMQDMCLKIIQQKINKLKESKYDR